MKKYLSHTWYDPRIEIGKSAISGNGMFARELIREGDAVAIVGGMAMTEVDFEAFRLSHLRYNAIQIDEDLHLVELPEINQAIEGSMNHSCDSNVWLVDEVTLVARQNIASGEEITVDYALFSAQKTWKLDHPCRCGSSHCRHTISGNDWMLKEVQERYGHYFSPFINRRIANMRLQSTQE